MKVLMIEDSERLRRAVGEGLRRSGFVVDCAADGVEGLTYLDTSEYDVVVLDILMPKLDGISLLKRIRAQGDNTHVLILSAKDMVQDRVMGLQVGADDYLVKPFAFDELVARIKALGRRSHDVKSPVIGLNKVRLDTAARSISVNGSRLTLTPAEYNLIECLALKRGRVLTKAQLHEALSNADSDSMSNVVEVLVSNIRKKLTHAGADKTIETKRGFGYFIAK